MLKTKTEKESTQDQRVSRLLPLLRSEGPRGLTLAGISGACSGTAHSTAASDADRAVELGHAFHSFRPRNGKVGRVARVIVAIEFAGEGHGVPNTSGWVQP